ncbi:MAG TPA: dienelactone hydrolase family protein [Gemmatimonadales bacterium]|nr:dienelactone hydrolase family protein [Gemmatimonadales bacterium]
MDPHAGQPVARLGPPVETSRAVLLLLHGRNAGPENILELAHLLPHPEFSYLAPAAAGNTWYPYSFLSETERNEPGLSSGLWVIDRLLQDVAARGVERSRVILLGFSQGGCLAAEYAVRHATRLGGVLALSGGLIGPPGTRWDYPGDFAGTPVLLGCSDVDPHIPRERVAESARVFERLGAQVTERIYPGLGHQVNEDELEFARQLMRRVAAAE